MDMSTYATISGLSVSGVRWHCPSCLRATKNRAITNNVLGPYCQHLLKQDMEGESFSLFVDESTDLATCKFLG